MAGKLPAIRAVQGNCQLGLTKNGANSHQSQAHNPLQLSQSQHIFIDQSITKGGYHLIGGHVSYPSDSPITTKLGLWSSLGQPGGPVTNGVIEYFQFLYKTKQIHNILRKLIDSMSHVTMIWDVLHTWQRSVLAQQINIFFHNRMVEYIRDGGDESPVWQKEVNPW